MSEERRTRFFKYFRNEFDLIASIGDREHKVHKKLCDVALLDTMAGLTFPRNNNRQRFVRLVKELGNWSNCDRISAPHLLRMLELNPAPEFDELRDIARNHVGGWAAGNLISLEADLEFNFVRSKWPKDNQSKEPLEGVVLEHLQHAYLLYSFRNAVVHSFRPLGSDFETDEDISPYYLSITRIGEASEKKKNYWDLIYPTEFFKSLTGSILSKVEARIAQAEIDPIEVLEQGPYWLQKLNR